jgi:hypothetical protein
MTIDLNPTAFKRADTVREIHDAVDRALVEKALKNPPRNYLGASSIGAGCERKTQLEYLGTAPDPDYSPEARTQRIFARGHLMEELAIGWLRDGGFDIRTRKPDGSQYGFAAADGRFRGHIDGVVMSGPGLNTPALWEHKAVGQKSWTAISRSGVVKAKPEYADQMAVYQAYMNLTEPALFQATNCDTMEIHFELVPFDKKRAQAASDRAVAIILDSEAGAFRPKATDDPDFYLCKGCQFRRRCHG